MVGISASFERVCGGENEIPPFDSAQGDSTDDDFKDGMSGEDNSLIPLPPSKGEMLRKNYSASCKNKKTL